MDCPIFNIKILRKNGSILRLFTDTARPVEIRIRIKKRSIAAIREAFNALMLVLEPGFEYRPSKGTKGTINYDTRARNQAKARNYFFTTIKKTDPKSIIVMDPTVSISTKGILIEGLSQNGQDMGSIFIPSASYTILKVQTLSMEIQRLKLVQIY